MEIGANVWYKKDDREWVSCVILDKSNDKITLEFSDFSQVICG